MELKTAETKEKLNKIRELYEKSFPENEKKPFSLICKKQKTKKIEILSIEEKDSFYGLMILAFNNDCVLLDYFAINPEFQSNGIGTKALNLLFEKMKDKKIIIEIESTSKKSDNQIQREKRKNFYLKNNFIIQPFKVNLFNVEMEILSNCRNINFEEYINVYINAYDKNFEKNILLLKN